MQIKIDVISVITDLDLLQKQIEALYYEVSRFDDTLIVSHTSASMNYVSGFRLARLLHLNSDTVSYTLDQQTDAAWQ